MEGEFSNVTASLVATDANLQKWIGIERKYFSTRMDVTRSCFTESTAFPRTD